MPDRESPLAISLGAISTLTSSDESGVLISEKPFWGYINLRADVSDYQALQNAGDVLGVEIPTTPNTATDNGDVSVLWLGPDEWLILDPLGREDSLIMELRYKLAGKFVSIVDVSGGNTIVNLEGPRSRDLLAKGCPLDLHPRVFGPGRCAQTLVAKAGVIIRQLDGSQSYDLIVRRSYADYLALWIEDAAREYGLTVAEECEI